MLSRSRSTRTLGLALALAAVPMAHGPGSQAVAQFSVREAFAQEPKTPMETWEVAQYLIRVGQPAQAAPYIKRFLDAKPDDTVLLDVRDTYGVGSILKLSDDPATRPYARPLLDRLNQASVRHATDPARITRSIASLSKSREEQEYGLEQLREAGPFAVPPLLQAMSVPGLDDNSRALLAVNLGRLDKNAVPALIAALDSDDAKVVSDAARALGMIGDPRAIPQLTYLNAVRPPSPARSAISPALIKLVGPVVTKTPSKILNDEARKYHLHLEPFLGDPTTLWIWNENARTPVATSFTVRDAEGLLGLKAAREAVALDPTNAEARVTLLSLGLDHAPNDWRTSALSAGAEILGRVARTAMADGRSDLAATALTLLAQVVDRNELLTEAQPNPMVQALSSPDRRLQFAAAEAVVQLDPRRRFVGSSRVVPILSRFVSAQSQPRALVVDGNPERGGQVAGFLRTLGYDSQVAWTGAKGFMMAAETADVEMIVVDPHFVNDPWQLSDLMGNLKADPRTSGIPIFVVGPLDDRARLGAKLESFPDVRFLSPPFETRYLKVQLDRAFKDWGVRPFSADDRAEYARRATAVLAQIARRPGSPFEADLPAAEPSLVLALRSPLAAKDAAMVLADIPGPDAQRSLADVALDASKEKGLRLVAAQQLTRHIRRFGPKLTRDQESRLLNELSAETDPVFRDALATVVGSLKPGPDASASRLSTYRATSP